MVFRLFAGPSHYANQAAGVSSRQSALVRARAHSINLVALHKQSDRLRVTMRQLNRFLTEVMEGEKRAGEGAFRYFVISLAAGYPALPESSAEVPGLYIKLSYGDNDAARLIPFELGRKLTLFQSETKLLTNEAARQTAGRRKKVEKDHKDQEWGYFYSRKGSASKMRAGVIIVLEGWVQDNAPFKRSSAG